MQSRKERSSKKKKKKDSKHEHKKKTLKKNVYISSMIHHLFKFIDLISYTYKHYENDFLQYFTSNIFLHFNEDIHQNFYYKNSFHYNVVLIISCKSRNTFQ